MRDSILIIGVVALLTAGTASGGTYAPIVVNGDFSDWADVPVLAVDPNDAVGVDWGEIKVANDDDRIYVYFKLYEAADPFTTNSPIFVDGDGNHGTGFQVWGGVIGSEMLIESSSVYQQAGGGWNEGALAAGTVLQSPFAVAATEFEMSIDRHVVGVAAPFDGMALITGTAIEFFFLDNVSGDSVQFSYVLASAPLCPGPLTTYRTMSIDGDFADWGFVPAAAVDPVDPGSAVDYAVVRAANDDEYLYLYLKLHTPGDPFSWDSNYYIDGDNDIGTGFQTFTVGSELFFTEANAYQQAGGGWNEGTLAAGTVLHSPFGWVSTEFELKVRRDAVGVAGDFVDAPLITGDTIRLVLQGDYDGVLDLVEFNYTFANTVCPGAIAPGGLDFEGRPLGDLDRDCTVDMLDVSIMQMNFTGP